MLANASVIAAAENLSDGKKKRKKRTELSLFLTIRESTKGCTRNKFDENRVV